MMEYIRSYEVSVWTLQDSFITILKSSNLENKEQIQDATVTLKDDGENKLTLTIPMYIYRDGKKVENPIWYNTRNGIISASMRKIKVIFNKNAKDENVFEFIITKVTEKHEGKKELCEIECDGLAFHELGKQGYKIVLSADVYYAEHEQWEEEYAAAIANNIDPPEEPINNINYWCEKVLKNSNWTYSICMDWSNIDGIITYDDYMSMSEEERDAINAAREAKGLRRRDRVYKDPYVSSWTLVDDVLKPQQMIEDEEKRLYVEGKESNRYNLIQTIAETFQVFTKFVYKYDDNYHIIGREVIFYNNFISEEKGTIDFTYAYDTQSLTREMDGTDLVSKMYVKPLNDAGTLLGTIGITDTSANPNLEDYLLNFDYLYTIGTITEEQYNEVKNYNAQLYSINSQMIELERELTPLRTKLPEKEAEMQTALDSAKLDAERVSNSSAFLDSLTDHTGIIVIDENNPHVFNAVHDTINNSGYYFRVGFDGLHANTLKLYRKRNIDGSLSDRITKFEVEYDEELGINPVKIYGIPLNENNSTYTTLNLIYGTYSYEPNVIHKKIIEIFGRRAEADRQKAADLEEEIENIKESIEEKEEAYEALAVKKQKVIDGFERLMGPALREGTWQPEDEYVDYKQAYTKALTINKLNNDIVSFGWDNISFDDEQLNYYYSDIEMNKTYYPCINLTNILNKFSDNNFRNNFSFIYEDMRFSDPNVTKTLRYLSIDTTTGCQFGFIRKKNNVNAQVIPVLFIVGAESMDPYTIDGQTYSVLQQLQNQARLGIVKVNTTLDVGYEITDVTTNFSWIDDLSTYECVYPRFQINSEYFINSETMNMIYQNGSLLEENKDYYILYRSGKWYTTLKNSVMYSMGNNIFSTKYIINFSISTAPLAIYLDAVQILKENSVPKVSYTIEPLLINKEFMYNAYNRLGQLAHINDIELKFEDVRGYISEVELNLDKPWEDKYTIKNYKTKFEDLFSTIVAQTEAMKKNSMVIGLAADLFTATGELNSDMVAQALEDSNKIQDIINSSPYIIAAQLSAEAASHKASLANSNALQVMNGNIGLAFPKSNKIEDIQLNRDVGLYIEGNNSEVYGGSSYFRVNNEAMGFFRKVDEGDDIPLLYFEAGDLALKGNIYAKNGWFGGEQGWIIGAGDSSIQYKKIDGTTGNLGDSGGLLYSANGKVIISAGTNSGNSPQNPVFGFYKTGFTSSSAADDAVLLFDGTNLYIKGKITATEGGSIGGWTIGANDLHSGTNGTYVALNGGSGDYALWAGAENASNASFSVSRSGAIKSTSGNLGGWYIGTNYIGNASTMNQSTIGLHYVSENSNDTKVIWSGDYFNYTVDGVAHQNPPFRVMKSGKLYAENADIKGDIKATSFLLKTGTSGGQDQYSDINTLISEGGSAITNTITEYVGSSSGTVHPGDDDDWSETIPSVNQGQYLWTRVTNTYSNGTISVSYSVAKQGTDGKYTTKIETLYYLKRGSGATTPPGYPSSSVLPVTSTSDQPGGWRTIVPTYSELTSNGITYESVYYCCEQYTWSDGTYSTSQSVYIDYGLKGIAKTATAASIEAQQVATTVETFTGTGLMANYTWPETNGSVYKIALVSGENTDTAKGLLIGANRGITIADTNSGTGAGTALVMDSGGIAMHGTTINLTTSSNHNTNVISLSPNSGITLASTVGVSLAGGTISLEGGLINLSAEGADLYLDESGVTTNSLAVSDDFTAPGFRRYYASYSKTIQNYNDLLAVKQVLEKNSYGAVYLTLNDEPAGTISKSNQVIEFNNLQIGYLQFSDTRGAAYLPPIKFNNGNVNVCFFQCAFDIPSNSTNNVYAVAGSGGGVHCHFVNSWIKHADIGLYFSNCASVFWERDQNQSWSNLTGTCEVAFCRLDNGARGVAQGVIPNVTSGNIVDQPNASGHIWQTIGTLTQAGGSSSSSGQEQAKTLNTYYANNLILALYKRTTTGSYKYNAVGVDLQTGVHDKRMYESFIGFQTMPSNLSTCTNATLVLTSNSMGINNTASITVAWSSATSFTSGDAPSISNDDSITINVSKNVPVVVNVTNLVKKSGFGSLVLKTGDISQVSNKSYSANYRCFPMDSISLTIE